MPATGAAATRGDFKQYTSGQSDSTTWASPNFADWVQVIGAGTVVVTSEADANRTITTDAAEPAACIMGPFKALVSTTATRVRMGIGDPPPIAVPASAVPGTTAALGGVKLSVAPADATSPIATGSNDPRVCTVEVPLPLVLSDGTMAESTIWIPGVVGTITGATLSANAAITQNDTNYLTFTLGIRDGAGGAAATVASKSTAVTGGGAFLAFVALTLGAITNATTAAISQVTFKSVKTGSGQAVTGPAMLRITYTVP